MISGFVLMQSRAEHRGAFTPSRPPPQQSNSQNRPLGSKPRGEGERESREVNSTEGKTAKPTPPAPAHMFHSSLGIPAREENFTKLISNCPGLIYAQPGAAVFSARLRLSSSFCFRHGAEIVNQTVKKKTKQPSSNRYNGLTFKTNHKSQTNKQTKRRARSALDI